jgi:hypothetical protein
MSVSAGADSGNRYSLHGHKAWQRYVLRPDDAYESSKYALSLQRETRDIDLVKGKNERLPAVHPSNQTSFFPIAWVNNVFCA